MEGDASSSARRRRRPGWQPARPGWKIVLGASAIIALLALAAIAPPRERSSPVARVSAATADRSSFRPTRSDRRPDSRPAVAHEAELAEKLESLALDDPEAAGNWLRTLDAGERRRLVAAILLAATPEPDRAVALGARFCRLDPAGATDHGYALVWALARGGEFEAALQFVELQRAAPMESEDPNKWLDRLFTAWAQEQPELAANRAATLPRESLRDEALHAVGAAWLRRDAPGLADFALRLPAGLERTALLGAFAGLE